jgi:hypothetical protein
VHSKAIFQILLQEAWQALPWNILCGVGIGFNFICDEMLGSASDEPVLRIDSDAGDDRPDS